ncbi:hypothetical protein [Streptomyces sp. NPDC006997]|uniref:hypothetical protein n=1 Tax=Streptomyces sp. NPDC006997 TaxID=3155356 RepID=UPI0034105511
MTKTRVLATITAKDIEQHRETLVQWATANGIEPHDVAATPGMTIEQTGQRTVIVYRQFQRAADGKLQMDPGRSDQVWTIKRSTPLRVPLPDLDRDGQDQPDGYSAP